jgi:hypothetical protein
VIGILPVVELGVGAAYYFLFLVGLLKESRISLGVEQDFVPWF